MPNLGIPEILMILIVALLVFGPRKLPEMARAAGQALRDFRKQTGAVTDELQAELNQTSSPEAPPRS